MLVCDSNVRGIRERNKLGLIIMSADVNPYKNKSSLLFFSPPRQIRRPELAAVVLIDALPPLVCSTHHLCDVDMQSVVHPSRCHHWSHRGTFDPRQTSLTARCHTQKKSWTHSEVYIYSVLPYVIQSCEGDSTVKTTDTSDECSFWDFFF